MLTLMRDYPCRQIGCWVGVNPKIVILFVLFFWGVSAFSTLEQPLGEHPQFRATQILGARNGGIGHPWVSEGRNFGWRAAGKSVRPHMCRDMRASNFCPYTCAASHLCPYKCAASHFCAYSGLTLLYLHMCGFTLLPLHMCGLTLCPYTCAASHFRRAPGCCLRMSWPSFL